MLISEKDAGVYDAFNKAIDLATGRYVYFIGAGDCLQPDILEQVKEFLPPEIPTLVYGNCYFVKQRFFNGRKFNSFDFTWTNICHQGEFFHRSIFDIIGKYDLRYKVFADWFLNFKCFVHQGINKQYIPLYIADYEEGGLSSHVCNDPTFNKDFPRYVKKELGFKAYFVCKALMLNPEAFYFIKGFGYKMLLQAVSVARPFVHGYRRLKKAINLRTIR
jgi:hypothetical protein